MVDKPVGPTSASIVASVKKLYKVKVGHGGTLDPLASGVLPLFLGKATRLSGYCLGGDKSYRATIKLGTVTSTDDVQGEVIETKDTSHLSVSEIQTVVLEFLGAQKQVPPQVSAIKVNGRAAYKRVRDGEILEMPARDIVIYSIEVLRASVEELEVEVGCSKGTYIRSLARDVGAKLGVGGCIKTLRRLKAGRFTAEQMQPVPDDMKSAILLPMDTAVSHLPQVDFDSSSAQGVVVGRKMEWNPQWGTIPDGDFVIRGNHSEFLAIGYVEDGLVRYRAVFANR